MRHRNLVPERMDDPDLDSVSHDRALDGLRRVNLLSGTAGYLAKCLVADAKKRRLQSLSILDLGCGAGDVAFGIAERLPASLSWSLQGWDVSPNAIRYAQQACQERGKRRPANASRVNAALSFHQKSAFAETSQSFDYVYCSLFFHHFDEENQLRLLTQMRRLARYGLVIDDLDRTWTGWLLAKIGVQLLSRSPIVHFDGPQSVKAALRPSEIAALARRAGLQHFLVRRHWPERWMFFADLALP